MNEGTHGETNKSFPSGFLDVLGQTVRKTYLDRHKIFKIKCVSWIPEIIKECSRTYTDYDSTGEG